VERYATGDLYEGLRCILLGNIEIDEREVLMNEEEQLILLREIYEKAKMACSFEDKRSICAGPLSQLVAHIAEILKLKDPENFFEHVVQYE